MILNTGARTDTVQYFSMVFRKEVGATPTVYRASAQSGL